MTIEPGASLDRRRIFIFLGLYFALQFLFRVLVSDGAELDEAEQLLLTQHLSLGYGSQPPLYTWLLSGLFSVFGANVATLVALKNVLLFFTYFFVYKSTEEVTGDENRAAVAMASLLLIPQFVWESQRDLTHSVMGTTLAAATLFVALRLARSRALRYYVLFGLCAGIGILSKYNYAFFLVALFAAGCSVRSFRPAFLDRRMLPALLCLLLVTAPHFQWMAGHLQTAMTHSGKFKMAQETGRLVSFAMGTRRLVYVTAVFVSLLVPVYAAFFFRPRPVASQRLCDDLPPSAEAEGTVVDAGDGAAFVKRIILATMLLCLAMVLFFKVTGFKDRWMQPLLFVVPVYLVTLCPGRFTLSRARGYLRLCLVVALTMLVLMPGHVLLGGQIGRVGRLNAPFPGLAAALRQAGFVNGVIVAQGRYLGGNLRLFFPESTVVAPEAPSLQSPGDGARLLVWDATEAPELPEGLRAFAAGRFATPQQLSSPPRYVEAPYRYGSGNAMRLGFVLLRNGAP